MERVESRALTYGWTSIFQIHNFLELYGQISIEVVRASEATYINTNKDRRSHISVQL